MSSSSSSWWWWLKKILVNVFHQLKHEKKWNQTSEKKFWYYDLHLHTYNICEFWFSLYSGILCNPKSSSSSYCRRWICKIPIFLLKLPASHDDDDHYDSFGDIVFFFFSVMAFWAILDIEHYSVLFVTTIEWINRYPGKENQRIIVIVVPLLKNNCFEWVFFFLLLLCVDMDSIDFNNAFSEIKISKNFQKTDDKICIFFFCFRFLKLTFKVINIWNEWPVYFEWEKQKHLGTIFCFEKKTFLNGFFSKMHKQPSQSPFWSILFSSLMFFSFCSL